MRRLVLGFVVCSIALNGCATAPSSPVKELSGGLPPGTVIPGAAAPAIVAISREFLPQATQIEATYAADIPTAYILLSRDQKKAARRLCAAWMSLPTSDRVHQLNPGAKIAKTYWLLGTGSSSADNCKKLVDTYDYDKGDGLRAAYALPPSGDLLAVHFPTENRTFFVDFTQANSTQDHDTLLQWYRTAATSNGPLALKSTSLAVQIRDVFCRPGNKAVGSLVSYVTGALGSFGFVVGIAQAAFCTINIV